MKMKFFVTLAFSALVGLSLTACGSDDKKPGPGPGPDGSDPSSIAAANLVAYMSFDGNATESKGHSVTTKGTPSYVTGMRGKCYQGSQGAGFVLDLPAGDRIATAKALTFSMWMKAPAPTGGSPALFQINGTTGDWDMPGSFNIQFQDASQLVTEVGFKMYSFNTATEWKGQWSDLFTDLSFTANQWFHVVFMYDNITSAYKAYANGTLVYENVRYAGPEVDGEQPLLGDLVLPADASKLYLFAWWKLLEGEATDDWAQYYVGNIDELRIYDKGLTDAEVLSLYNAEVDKMD